MTSGSEWFEELPESLREEAESLLAECIDRLNAGGGADLEELLERHPEVGPLVARQLRAFEGCAEPAESPQALGVLGDYVLRRRIGRGGMGVVYEAWQSSMERRVALKVLPGGLAADEKACQRFLREARTAGKLNHPHIVHVHGLGIEEETPYYAMEYVEGETLAQIIAAQKEGERGAATPFGPRGSAAYFEALAEAFAGVAEGLHHAHGAGVVHRDIKPSNLILERQGRLRILDFGLARNEGQETLTETGEILGTPLYMSPEQARRRRIAVDHRTDVYSLGATLYELVAGRPPFRGRNHQETLSQIIEADPLEPRRLEPRLPEGLENVVLKSLRKHPDERYLTAEAMAQDLRRFARGEPVEARPPSRWQKLARRLWRHRLGAAALVVLSVLGATSGLLVRGELAAARAGRERLYREKVLAAIAQIELARPDSRIRGLREEWALAQLEHQAGLWDVDGALEVLREAAALVPERPEAYYHEARAHERQGQYGKALAMLDRALERDRAFLPARVLRSLLREQLAAAGAELEGSAGGPASGEADEEEKLWLRAWRAVREGEWQEAVEAYGELLQKGAGSSSWLGADLELYLARGRARLELFDHDGALCDFAAARALWPELVEPALLLVETYWKKGKPKQAEAILEEICRAPGDRERTAAQVLLTFRWLNVPRSASRWIGRLTDGAVRELLEAVAYFWESLPVEAHAAVTKAMEAGLETAVSYHWRGASRMEMGDSAGALADWRRALELNASFRQARLSLARGLARLERFDEALREIEALLASNPLDSDALVWKSELLSKTGNSSAAETAFGALVTAVGRGTAHYLRARVGRELGDLKAALEDADAALQSRPKHWGYSGFRSLLLRDGGDLDGSLAALERTLELNPSSHEAYVNRGVLRLSKGDPEGAIRDYSEALRLEPSNRTARYNRANERWSSGDRAGAIADLSELLDYHPEDLKACQLRGRFRLRHGDIDGAVADFTEVIRRHPAPTQALLYRGGVYESRGDFENAALDLTMAIDGLDRGLLQIHDRARIVLRPGWNLLQFKVFQGEIGWLLRARLEDPESGEPLRRGGLIELRADRNGEAIAGGGAGDDGFFREYLILGPYSNPRGCSPGHLFISRDWLCDGVTDEARIVPEEGLTLGPPGPCAAPGSEYLGEGPPELKAARAYGNTLLLDSLLSPRQNLMAYAWVWVRNDSARDLPVVLALASDDSVHVKLNGIEILSRSVCRGLDVLPYELESALRLRARCFRKLGHIDEAYEDYTTALERFPPHPHSYSGRGKLWVLRGNPEKAIEDLDAALALLPDADGRLWRAVAHSMRGDHASAVADVDAFLDPTESRGLAPPGLALAARVLERAAAAETAAEEAERHARRAVELLIEARKLGWDPTGVLEARPELRFLERQPGFEAVFSGAASEPPAAAGEGAGS